MSALGDKFKAFVNGEINLPKLKKLVDLKNVALQLVKIGDGNGLININVDKRKVTNVTVNVDSKDLKSPEIAARQIGALVQEHVQGQKKPVLEINASEVVNEITTIEAQYSQYIDYFKGKIPEKDLLILRAAYFIRQEHEKGANVTRHVQGVTATHGTRGGNIVKLCGRGYFEDYLKPLYETLAQNPTFTKEQFLDNYELIIENAPFAYYVSARQTKEVLVAELLEKIPFGKKYGQSKLAIHAIGSENVKHAQQAIADERIASLIITDDTEIDLKKNVLTLTIFYKK